MVKQHGAERLAKPTGAGAAPALLWLVVFSAMAAEIHHESIWYGALFVAWVGALALVPTGDRLMEQDTKASYGMVVIAAMFMFFDTLLGLLFEPVTWAMVCTAGIVYWHFRRRHGELGGIGAGSRLGQMAVAAIAIGVMTLSPRGLRSDAEFLFQIWRHGAPRTLSKPEDLAAPEFQRGRIVVIEGQVHCMRKPEEVFHHFDCSELQWTRSLPQLDDPLPIELPLDGKAPSLPLQGGLVVREKTRRTSASYDWREVGDLGHFIERVNRYCARMPAALEEAAARCASMKEEMASHLWLKVPDKGRPSWSWAEWVAAADKGRLAEPLAYVLGNGQDVDRAFSNMAHWLAEQRLQHILKSYRAPTDGVRLKVVAGERMQGPDSFRVRRNTGAEPALDRFRHLPAYSDPVGGTHRLLMHARGEPFRVSGVLLSRSVDGDGVPRFEIDARRPLSAVAPVRNRLLSVLLGALVIAWHGSELLASAFRRRVAAP